jgi:hypothetical protein
MGTSKSFSDANKSMIPNWGDLSSAMTTSCDSSTLQTPKLQSILKNFVNVLGGATKAGRGGSKIGGKGGIKTAKKIGGLFSTFTGSGNDIRQTLQSTGLTDIDNKSVADIINHLIEYCSGTASTIDENAAKEASRLLFEELIADAESIDEIEINLSNKFNSHSSEEIIIKYFGYYINELLSKWFYEKLIKDKNEKDCNNLFQQIKNFIIERVSGIQKNRLLQNIDWSSNEADKLIKDIQQDILTVFE